MFIVTSQNLIAKYTSNIISNLQRFTEDIIIVPSGSTPEYIQSAINQRNLSDPCWIVGGSDIIPFYQAVNPFFFHDGDPVINTDSFYAISTNDLTMPQRIVCRLPDEQGSFEISNFLTILDNLYNLFSSQQTGNNLGTIYNSGFFSQVGTYFQQQFTNIFSINDESPPVLSTNINLTDIQNKEYLFLNLNGGANSYNLYGQLGTDMMLALTPNQIGSANGSKVFISASYAGNLNTETNIFNNILLSFLFNGAVSVVASTEMTFGNIYLIEPNTNYPISPPISQIGNEVTISEAPEATNFSSMQQINYFANPNFPLIQSDYLSYLYFQNLFSGQTSGQAFMNAKNQYVQNLNLTSSIEKLDYKTLLEFNLYGFPLI